MKKFWKCFFEILMTFVKKCRELLYKFLSISMEILYSFYISFWKNLRRIVWKNQLLVKSIDTYWFRKVSISIDTYPITNRVISLATDCTNPGTNILPGTVYIRLCYHSLSQFSYHMWLTTPKCCWNGWCSVYIVYGAKQLTQICLAMQPFMYVCWQLLQMNNIYRLLGRF